MRARMTFLALILALLLVAAGTPGAQAGTIQVLGIDTGSSWDYNIVSALSGISFTEVSVAAFATVDLNLFDVLFISETFLDAFVTLPAQATLNALNAREADIASWLAAGGGIVALSQPIGTGRFAWLPDAIQPTVGPQIGDDSVVIVNPAHPVMSTPNTLTSAGLSGWDTSSHGNFTSTGGLDVLVTDGGTRPITLAGTFGFGRVVITDQDPDFHFTFGLPGQQVEFVQNAINWVAAAGPPSAAVPEPSTWALSVVGATGLIVACWRKRKQQGNA